MSRTSAPEAGQAAGRLEEFRVHVGHADYYDILSAIQFNLLTTLGLRDDHYLLDIGCGSLRAGRLFIPYLRPERYFGIEPLAWLIEEGIRNEVGESMLGIKRPTFSHDENFTLSAFGTQFDFMIAQSIFSHTSQEQIRRCVGEAKKCLKPDGLFAATFFEAPHNYEGNHWVAKAEYTMERMRELIEGQAMACTPILWRHPDPQQWMVIHHPGTSVPLAQAGAGQHIVMLEAQLATNRRQLMNIRSHPYVRLGLKLQPFLIWLRFTSRRFVRSVRRTLGRNGAEN